MGLEEHRNRIDDIDRQILKLLNERARYALEIGKIKDSTNAVCYVPEREKLVHEALKAQNEGPLPDTSVRAIFREIISAVRALERPVSVAFLGPKDTFSHMAALRIFGSRTDFHPLASVADIFTEVERKRVDYGVAPAETSMSGGVSDTLDRFISSDLKIINEVMLHITQNLLSNTAITAIKRVYSKEQPFVQCRNWLKSNLPNAELVRVSSTAEAARLASLEAGSAAIASRQAAETYQLEIVAPGIEDAAHNYTRFFVIGRQLAKPTGHDKTAIMMGLKDRPGGLHALLEPLASRGVNLTRIESRPSQKRAWEYLFFVEMLGHVDDEPIREALELMRPNCHELKVLGSFPQGALEE